MKSDRKLYLTRDGSAVVEKGDPKGVTLLVAAGGVIDAATAKKYDLKSVDGKVVIGGAESEPEEVAEVEEAGAPEAEEAAEEEVEEAPKPRAKKPVAKARKK